ncbi:MAG: hypothetical protein ACE5F4_02100 [Candidatus Paceibacteria bacterium]
MLSGLIPFTIGLVGILAFVSLRLFETRRGARFFERSRARFDEWTIRRWRAVVLGDIPHHARIRLVHSVRHGAHALVTALAAGFGALERLLARMSRRMRASARRTSTHEARDPSPFLKDIGGEKKERSEEARDSL